MATTESAAASLGPRYAPEDPTLPKPWKGLIDGSTGLQYYWNPETNVTQYERPPSTGPPPLPLGPPPTVSTPKLAPIPSGRTVQPNGMQIVQHPALQQSQQPSLQMLQQLSPQVAHQQGPQTSQVQSQQMPQQQSPRVPLQQGQQFPQVQLQHSQYQQPGVQQGKQVQQPHGQQISQPQIQPFGFTPREEIGFQQGKQAGFSSSQVQQSGFPSVQNVSAGTQSGQIPQMGVHSVQPQPTGATGSSLVHVQQVEMRQEMVASMSHNHSGFPNVHNQRSGPVGLHVVNDEDQRGRAGNEFYFNNKEATGMFSQQPKPATFPMSHNQQDTRMASHPQGVPSGHPGGLNSAVSHPMSNMYNHQSGVAGQSFPNVNQTRPSPRMMGPLEPSNHSAADVYRQQHEVTAMGDNVPAPFMTFEATGFPPEILRELQFAGFTSPTPIQAQTWPVALQSRDIVAIARTGSGKTLGYLIPAFVHLRRSRNNSKIGPTVLILAPTRELATQIQDEAIKFGRSSRVSCACLYGGAPKGPQLRDIERGADIVVATPGRLNDILEMKKINFSQVSFLILDEADRMLDMGFEPQIRKIVNEIPPRRQTLMYTATWPKEVRKIAGDLLVNPVQVNIGSIDELAANKSITQYVEVVSPMEKQRRLEQILRSQERGSKIIIFCSTKRLCDQLARSIGRTFGAAAIHGDKSQGERDWVLNQFRSGKAPILVATDVAARGLDIKDIRVVINYDFPTGIEDYVHRIGRTGRAGATGISYTFFSDQDWKYAADLVKVLEGANQRVPPEVREMAARGAPSFSKGRGGSRWESGGGRWESGGRGGGRDGFGGRDGGYGGGRGGRNDFFGGRGNRGRGFGGPGGRGRHDRALHDRYDSMDGRGRFDNRRGGFGGRSRGRSYSRSPERVRTWDYSRSPSRSHSRSRSRSRSWTRSRSRSRSRSWSRSRSRSWSRSRSRSHSPSRSIDRYERSRVRRSPRRTGFGPPPEPQNQPAPDGAIGASQAASARNPPVAQISSHLEDPGRPSLEQEMSPMSPMSPARQVGGSSLAVEPPQQPLQQEPAFQAYGASHGEPAPEPGHQPVGG
ncbi:DEAD-box ATP-dependent RNA helicase 46-like [Aristolochia californica]|uniref:DEAD-box ATP-dependent RNA helicase 46-like n=1 Tax=Aristolochia californica TaxID=171875 RepID=UPI0035DFD1F1